MNKKKKIILGCTAAVIVAVIIIVVVSIFSSPTSSFLSVTNSFDNDLPESFEMSIIETSTGNEAETWLYNSTDAPTTLSSTFDLLFTDGTNWGFSSDDMIEAINGVFSFDVTRDSIQFAYSNSEDPNFLPYMLGIKNQENGSYYIALLAYDSNNTTSHVYNESILYTNEIPSAQFSSLTNITFTFNCSGCSSSSSYNVQLSEPALETVLAEDVNLPTSITFDLLSTTDADGYVLPESTLINTYGLYGGWDSSYEMDKTEGESTGRYSWISLLTNSLFRIIYNIEAGQWKFQYQNPVRGTWTAVLKSDSGLPLTSPTEISKVYLDTTDLYLDTTNTIVLYVTITV